MSNGSNGSISVIAQLLPINSGGYAYQPADVSHLHRQDGSASQPGDVLSVQPDGTLQTRSADQIGKWETLTLSGPLFVYTTDGTRTVLIAAPGL